MEKLLIEPNSAEIEIKKSRFISHFKAVATAEEALQFVEETKKKYWDARHNCYAYIVGDQKRFSDDGEPQGTAGKPMLEVLESRNLINAVVVVTRYFGGVLLGTGGLLRAYQQATIEGLDKCVIEEKKQGIRMEITTDYNGFGKIQYIAANDGAIVLDTQYTDKVLLDVVCEKDMAESFINKVTEATAGQAVYGEKKEVVYYGKGIII
ncbi:MAG: YigZ family protein [Lachnospiraceae bacterium]|nr:YigZ family protein [Lachnospiraceae bacterium]